MKSSSADVVRISGGWISSSVYTQNTHTQPLEMPIFVRGHVLHMFTICQSDFVPHNLKCIPLCPQISSSFSDGGCRLNGFFCGNARDYHQIDPIIRGQYWGPATLDNILVCRCAWVCVGGCCLRILCSANPINFIFYAK